MGIKQDERNTYNLSIEQVEATNKRLQVLYRDSLEKAELELIKLRTKLLKGGVVSPFQEARLIRLIQALQKEVIDLRIKSTSIIRQGYINNFKNTYYLESYAWEKSLNTELSLGADYSLNIPALDKKLINASFDKRVGGHIFKDRTLRVQREMQYLIQDAVSQNIIEGQSVKQLAKNIDILNNVYGKGLSQTTRIARTELLKSYSIGQDTARIEAEASGVEFEYMWSARLDSRIRPDHARADNQKAIIIDGKPEFLVGGIKFTSPRLPVISTGSKQEAKEVINCRCRRLNLPFGIEPTNRITKLKNGEWATIPANTNAVDWVKSEYGVTLK